MLRRTARWAHFDSILFTSYSVRIVKTNDKSKRVRERLTLLCTNSSWTKVKYCVFVCTKPCKHPNENKHSDGCWYNHSSAKCLANTSQHWSAALIDGTRAFMYKIYIYLCTIDMTVGESSCSPTWTGYVWIDWLQICMNAYMPFCATSSQFCW